MIATIAVHCPGCRPTRIVSKEPHRLAVSVQRTLNLRWEIVATIYYHPDLVWWKPYPGAERSVSPASTYL